MPGGLLSRLRGKKDAGFAPLLDSSGSDSGDELEDPLIRPAPSVAPQVGAMKQAGRQAKAGGSAIGSTRTQDALGGMKQMAVAGAEMGLDAVAPGAGYAVAAASAASSLRDAKNEGRDVAGAGAREGASIAAGFIPVVGEFLGFAEGLYTTVVAVAQPSKSRTAEKVTQAEGLIQDGAAKLTEIDAIRPAVLDTGNARLIADLDKAQRRIETSIDQARAWVAKKEDHGTMPLASSLASDDWATFDS